MTPEFQTMMNQLAEIVKGMQPPPLPDQPTREMVDSLTQAHQAQMQARQGELNALVEKLKQLPKPQKPARPQVAPIPKIVRPALSLGPRGSSHLYVVDKMLEIAALTKDDILYDLGSGSGRIVERAADDYRIQAGGIEILPALVDLARKRAIFLGLKSYVDYKLADAETVDLSRATVVTLFLSPEGNLKLRPRLQEQLPNGARVVSNCYDMGDWKPDVVAKAKDHRQAWHTIYLWRIQK